MNPNTPLYLFYNWIIWILWMTTFNVLLPCKYSKWLTWIIEAFVFTLYYSISLFIMPEFSVFRLALGELIKLSILLFLHRGSIRAKLLICGIVFIIALIADLFTFYLGGFFPTTAESSSGGKEYPLWQYGISLLIEIIFLSILVIIGLRLRKQFTFVLNTHEMYLLLLFPASQIVLIVYRLNVLWTDTARFHSSQIILPFALCLLADFNLFFLIASIAKASSVSYQIHLLEEEHKRQDRFYASLANDYEHALQMRSEIVEQWNIITDLVKQGSASEAIIQTNKLSKLNSLTPELFNCKNRTIASFLQHKLDDLFSAGIDTYFNITMPSEIGIPNPDLVCLFGNLLDNASEACLLADYPKISLIADCQYGYLRVKVENTYKHTKQTHRRRIPELERGIGFHILHQLTIRYDGELITHEDGNCFHTSVIWKGDYSHDSSRGL